jgi:hypothetical protein
LGRYFANLCTHRIGLSVPLLCLGQFRAPLQFQGYNPIDIRTGSALKAIGFDRLGVFYNIFSIKHVQ